MAQRETVRVDMRRTVRLLSEYGYPLDPQDEATRLVIRQAELMAENTVGRDVRSCVGGAPVSPKRPHFDAKMAHDRRTCGGPWLSPSRGDTPPGPPAWFWRQHGFLGSHGPFGTLASYG
jgi:Type I restriction enzyme HindI endonuclease subunit-like, C-terminal